jgi:hypothetical protein
VCAGTLKCNHLSPTTELSFLKNSADIKEKTVEENEVRGTPGAVETVNAI